LDSSDPGDRFPTILSAQEWQLSEAVKLHVQQQRRIAETVKQAAETAHLYQRRLSDLFNSEQLLEWVRKQEVWEQRLAGLAGDFHQRLSSLNMALPRLDPHIATAVVQMRAQVLARDELLKRAELLPKPLGDYMSLPI
jgi:hypothetical protein